MPFLALVVPFLKTWWKVILPVVLLMLALGYVKALHWQIDHYKEEVVALRSAIAEAERTEKELQDAAEVQTAKYKDSLRVRAVEIELKAQDIIKEIKKDEASKRIALSRDVVRLFNDSKPKAGPEAVANPKPEDDGKAATNLTSLNDLLVVSSKNDANHQVCIDTVDEWQRFWTEYVANYKAVANGT